MKSKKGVIGMQFNWIFILIAGAVILLFFSGVIVKQKGISDTSANAMTLNSLDAILSGAEISAGTVNVVKIPKTRIEVKCNGYMAGEVSKQFNGINIFSPSVLDDNEVIVMTLGWNVPYRITNFIYLTNPKIRYVFIGDSDFARSIFEIIPDEIKNDGYTNVNIIQDENDNVVRIIFFGQNPEVPKGLKGTDASITALKIDGDENKGKAEFFDLVDDKFELKGTSYYIGVSGLLGAVFTDDVEIYECRMKSAFENLNIVSQVYQEKIIELKNNQLSSCRYDDNTINNIIAASNTFDQSSINEIDIAAESLEEQNKKLQKKSCALIY